MSDGPGLERLPGLLRWVHGPCRGLGVVMGSNYFKTVDAWNHIQWRDGVKGTL